MFLSCSSTCSYHWHLFRGRRVGTAEYKFTEKIPNHPHLLEKPTGYGIVNYTTRRPCPLRELFGVCADNIGAHFHTSLILSSAVGALSSLLVSAWHQIQCQEGVWRCLCRLRGRVYRIAWLHLYYYFMNVLKEGNNGNVLSPTFYSTTTLRTPTVD